MNNLDIQYQASPTLSKFHQSTAFVRGVRGPIGSGKSVGCCFELFRRMGEQAPDKEGRRRTRWAVIRNTYPELETTTIKTWLDWFPEDVFGKMNRRVPICHQISYEDIEAEVYFIALNRPEDIKKLLSLELTGIWYNEAREIPLENILMGCDRVGRYPSQRGRPDDPKKENFVPAENWPSWYGVIMDTNAPEEDHWWPMYSGELPPPEDWVDWQKPDNWDFFSQPPAAFETRKDGKLIWVLNPDAENLKNLPQNYYKNLIQGKPAHHVRVYVANKYGSSTTGKLVYPEYSDDFHKADTDIKPVPGRTIHCGLDFGRTPAAVFGQYMPDGQWVDLMEITTEGMGAKQFGNVIKRELSTVLGVALNQVEFWGDPSGAYSQGGEDRSYFDILKGMGIPVKPAPTQNASTRMEAGREPLERILAGGKPGYKVNPRCRMLIRGYRIGYHYPRLGTTGTIRYADKPEKNKFSHPHEARQYMLCGAGFGKEVTGKGQWKKGQTFKAKTGFKIFN